MGGIAVTTNTSTLLQYYPLTFIVGCRPSYHTGGGDASGFCAKQIFSRIRENPEQCKSFWGVPRSQPLWEIAKNSAPADPASQAVACAPSFLHVHLPHSVSTSLLRKFCSKTRKKASQILTRPPQIGILKKKYAKMFHVGFRHLHVKGFFWRSVDCFFSLRHFRVHGSQPPFASGQ